MTEQRPLRPFTVLRRVVVGLIIASFGIAAVLGIVVLLGFEIGDTTWKVLATTAIVGSYSVAVLCCAALLGRPAQLVGLIGVAVSVLSAAWTVFLVWDETLWRDAWDTIFRLLWTGIALTAALSLASLLLLLSNRRRPVVRTGLWITLGLLTLLLALTLYLAWATDIDNEVFPRVYGIVGILTALGAVVVPVLSLLLPDQRAAPPPGLSVASVARLRDEATRRGVTVDELVARLVPPPVDRPAPVEDSALDQ